MPTQPDAAAVSARVSPTAPASKSASANVWAMLERLPGFAKRMATGRRQLAAGKSVPFNEVRRRR
jgi:hypothetical protein